MGKVQFIHGSQPMIKLQTVNGTGLVTGVAPGKVKITATDQETQLSASVEVTVNPVAVQSVTVTPESTSVEREISQSESECSAVKCDE